MHTESFKHGIRPVGYLTNAAGKRTHAIVPLVESSDDWGDLPSVKADATDLAFMADFKKNTAEYRSIPPVQNPIRKERLRAKITQEILAKALGISAAALSKQEQEGHVPRPRTIARALAKIDELRK